MQEIVSRDPFNGIFETNGGKMENIIGTSLKQERVCNGKMIGPGMKSPAGVMDYIALFYKKYRLHSYLDYISPSDFEKSLLKVAKAAELECTKKLNHFIWIPRLKNISCRKPHEATKIKPGIVILVGIAA